jgi:PTS system mannose-specific IID component
MGPQKLKNSTLVKIFLRSFFIHSTLNFRKMQNLGFAMAVIPAVREWNLSPKDTERILTRHLQMFNTHPYFSASVIGAVVRLEEEQVYGDNMSADAVVVKQSLMGPYAAIGDTFFWGALRPCAAIIAIILGWLGIIIAPLVFLLIYTPVHFWVRMKGFIEGYRKGKQGIEFIRIMDLPRFAVRLRWIFLVMLSLFAVLLTVKEKLPSVHLPGAVINLGALAIILFCFMLIKRRISQFYILYGAFVIFILISMKEVISWWK